MPNVITRMLGINEQKNEIVEEREFDSVTIDALTGSTVATANSIMQIPTVKACLDTITGHLASLPVYLYQEKNGVMKKIEDSRTKLLNDQSAPNMSAINTRKLAVKDYLLNGVAYLEMEKEKYEIAGENIFVDGKIKKLVHLPTKNVNVTTYSNNGRYPTSADFEVTSIIDSNSYFNRSKLKENDLLRILNNPLDAYKGVGIAERGKIILGQALDEMDYTSGIYKNGAMPTGILKSAARLSETAVKNLTLAWQKLYGGAKNSAKTVILQEGLEYQALQLNPDQIQMTETKKATNTEICKLFGVPESMISPTANKYNSIEQNNLSFLKSTLAPIIADFQNAYDQYLLTDREKAEGYQFRFDTSELLRTTEKEKNESVQALYESGLISFNESRYKLDQSPIEDKDDYFAPSLGRIFINKKTGEIKNPNVDGGTANQTKGNDSPNDN